MRSGGGGGVAKRVDGREKSHPANRRLVLRSPPPAAVSSAVQATSRCYQAMQHDAGAGPAFGQIFRLNSLLLLLLQSRSRQCQCQVAKNKKTLLSYFPAPAASRLSSLLFSEPPGSGEEERSLIVDLKRHTQLAVAWNRHGSLVPRSGRRPACGAWARSSQHPRVSAMPGIYGCHDFRAT